MNHATPGPLKAATLFRLAGRLLRNLIACDVFEFPIGSWAQEIADKLVFGLLENRHIFESNLTDWQLRIDDDIRLPERFLRLVERREKVIIPGLLRLGSCALELHDLTLRVLK